MNEEGNGARVMATDCEVCHQPWCDDHDYSAKVVTTKKYGLKLLKFSTISRIFQHDPLKYYPQLAHLSIEILINGFNYSK